MFIIRFQGNYHFGIMHTMLNRFLSLKGVTMKAAVFAPPISILQLLEGLQKTLWFLVTWVNWIMARILCPLQCVHSWFWKEEEMMGTHFHSILIFSASVCHPSVFWCMNLRKGSILIDICMRGRKLMFSHSLLDWWFDVKVQLREGIILE